MRPLIPSTACAFPFLLGSLHGSLYFSLSEGPMHGLWRLPRLLFLRRSPPSPFLPLPEEMFPEGEGRDTDPRLPHPPQPGTEPRPSVRFSRAHCPCANLIYYSRPCYIGLQCFFSLSKMLVCCSIFSPSFCPLWLFKAVPSCSETLVGSGDPTTQLQNLHYHLVTGWFSVPLRLPYT